MLSSNFIASVLGATFVLVGLLGFVPNPIVAPDGIFAVNTAHNLVHVLTGLTFFSGVWDGHARIAILGIGIAYVAVTALGFVTTGDTLLGLVHINLADRWLHAFLAVAILSAWWVSDRDVVAPTPSKQKVS